jgi:hypothetical protein
MNPKLVMFDCPWTPRAASGISYFCQVFAGSDAMVYEGNPLPLKFTAALIVTCWPPLGPLLAQNTSGGAMGRASRQAQASMVVKRFPR